MWALCGASKAGYFAGLGGLCRAYGGLHIGGLLWALLGRFKALQWALWAVTSAAKWARIVGA